jgi:hypothetical protein
LALTSPTSGGRSVGIVRLWTKATKLIILKLLVSIYIMDLPKSGIFLNILIITSTFVFPMEAVQDL